MKKIREAQGKNVIICKLITSGTGMQGAKIHILAYVK